MGVSKKSKSTLIISVIIMMLSLFFLMILPDYDYSKVDFSKDKHKILKNGELTWFGSELQSNGEYKNEFIVDLFNSTEESIDDVVVRIYMKDIDGQDFTIKCKSVSVESRKDKSQVYITNSSKELNDIINVTVQIADGEEFDILDIDGVLPSNSLQIAMAIIFFVSMIAVIALSVVIFKKIKRQEEIENKAYEKRADEMVEQEIRKKKLMVDQMEREMNETQKTPPPAKVKCSYCGCDNDATENKCRVCGARLHK